LKICLVNSFFPPWRGGAETYVHELAKALCIRGHEVVVVCTSDPLLPGTYDVDGVRVERLRRLARLYGTPIQAGLFRKLAECGPDIFHANFPSPYLAFNVALASFRQKIPAVITWHNDLPSVTSGARFLIETHNRLLLPKYIQEYRKVIATSETYRRRSPILTSLGSRVVVINNGVDCQRFRPDIDSASIESQFRLEGKFVVLFVGALTKWHGYKGLDILLEAMRLAVKSLPRILLLVVGEGDLRSHYEYIAQLFGLQENVIFAGNVPDDELPKFYATCDVVAVPSKDMSEGFGLTVLEANASGRPCIGSSVGGIPEVLCDGYNGLLVAPTNAQALANRMLRLAKDERMRKEMGTNGRKVALQHDWKIVARKTELLYAAAMTGEVSEVR
jgi:glycosyltransferase involved in cell wall biosynthesis